MITLVVGWAWWVAHIESVNICILSKHDQATSRGNSVCGPLTGAASTRPTLEWSHFDVLPSCVSLT